MKGKPARQVERILRQESAPIIGKRKKTTVLFAISMYRYPHPRTVNLIERMLNDIQGRRSDLDIIMGQQIATGLIASRKVQFNTALVHNTDYMCLADDDMFWPQTEKFNALERMIELDKDIVSAVCFTRKMPMVCLVSLEDDAAKLDDPTLVAAGEPFQVKWTGFGLILIKRHVIEKLADYCGGVENIPNFQCNWRTLPQTAEMLDAAKTPEEIMEAVDWLQRRAQWWYEDYSFCKKALECGFEIWADPSFEVSHIGDYDYTMRDWMWMLKQQEKEAANAGNSP